MARRGPDPLEPTMEEALEPGRFIPYGRSFDFVNGLENVRDSMQALVDTGESVRAVSLYETFIAGCYLKAEEIDDSGGSLGQFAEELFCDWIRARQAAGSDARETAQRILDWMDEDDYGFCFGLERTAVQAFDRPGLAAFERLVRERFEAEAAKDAKAREERDPRKAPPYSLRQPADVLKTVYEAQGRADAYLGVCEAMGEWGLAPEDCERLAKICRRRRKPEDALVWTERGLELEARGGWGSRSGYELETLKRELLTKTGRKGDALHSAWDAFASSPSEYSYKELMKYVPRKDRADWHAKAMAVMDSADLGDFIDVCVKTREWEKLAGRLLQAGAEEIEGLSHYTTDPAAKRLSRTCPEAAAKLYAAMGMRTLESGKAKYYRAAVDHFASAKRLYEKADLHKAWAKLVEEVRGEHGRKHSFIPDFEELAAGRRPKSEPSFLERARRRRKKKRTR